MDAELHAAFRSLEAILNAQAASRKELEESLEQAQDASRILEARVQELEDENREFKKVSRIVAYERENATLRRQLAEQQQQRLTPKILKRSIETQTQTQTQTETSGHYQETENHQVQDHQQQPQQPQQKTTKRRPRAIAA
jgi:predicted RNase H-like nuclease (RuvC/YqgF family)